MKKSQVQTSTKVVRFDNKIEYTVYSYNARKLQSNISLSLFILDNKIGLVRGKIEVL